ncbi:MAG TPA: PQQ-binding-like beta-propeller repeat protein [Terriglobia bacterium]|nr:PQQ-binding-like beta-propeller repeat protein [Terriglobia bacterium]
MRYLILTYVIFLSSVRPAPMVQAQDWPQFLGPARNGKYAGTDLTTVLPKAGPPVVWKKAIGQGFSGPVVAEGKLVLFHRLGDKEVVEALDAATGKEIWRFDYPTRYRDDFGFDEGPRSTPVIAYGRVYTFGAEGMLHCVDFATGKKLWAIDTHQQYDVRKGFFGAACSPLVEGRAVLLNIGGSKPSGLVAFDRETGKVLWAVSRDEASYSSPVAATVGGLRTVFCFTRNGLIGADPANGSLRFEFPWRARMQASVNAAVPLVAGDFVFISASYQTGAALLQVAGSTIKKVWSSDDVLSNHYASSVVHSGYLYGFHGRQEHGPSLRCVELQTGKVMWSVDSFGSGTLTLAGAHLILIREGGELAIAAADPKAFRPVAKAQIMAGTVRAYPALAQGRLYVRNENSLVCFSLKK